MSVMFNMFMSDDVPSTVSAGTPLVLKAGRTAGQVRALAKISTTQAVAFFNTQGGGTTLYDAVVLTVSGTSLSAGSVANLYDSSGSEEGNYGSLASVSSTKVVAGYGTNKAMVLDISGTSITTNTQATIPNATDYISIGSVSSGGVIALYNGSTYNVSGRILTISGSTLSANTEYSISTSASASVGVGAAISSSKYLSRFSNGATVQLMVLDISGAAITTNTSLTVTNAALPAIASSVAVNNSEKATALYVRTAGAGNGVAGRIITISGSTLTLGSETVIDATGVAGVGIADLNTDGSIIEYGNSTQSGMSAVLASTTAITAFSPTQFDAGAVNGGVICGLDETTAITLYVDTGNSSQITACALRVI